MLALQTGSAPPPPPPVVEEKEAEEADEVEANACPAEAGESSGDSAVSDSGSDVSESEAEVTAPGIMSADAPFLANHSDMTLHVAVQCVAGSSAGLLQGGAAWCRRCCVSTPLHRGHWQVLAEDLGSNYGSCKHAGCALLLERLA